MARLSVGEIFNNVRAYLDTDDLNFPNPLLDTLLQRIWYQAVTMEREWRFFQRRGTYAFTYVDGVVNHLIPMQFVTGTPGGLAGVRVMAAMWEGQTLVWREASVLIREMDDQIGTPCYWTELNDGPQRNIALYPAPGSNGTLTVEFYAEPVYPVVVPNTYTGTFADLPPEFDGALQEGLLAEMYMREEDPDLYDVHRNMFLEQMGAIRNRWRTSLETPIVMGMRALGADPGSGGWYWPGYVKRPAAG